MSDKLSIRSFKTFKKDMEIELLKAIEAIIDNFHDKTSYEPHTIIVDMTKIILHSHEHPYDDKIRWKAKRVKTEVEI